MSPRPSSFLLALSLGLAVALAGCAKKDDAKAATTEAPAVLTVSTQAVAVRPLASELALTGSVAAWDQLPVMPAANGLLIKSVLTEEGQLVHKGQLLVQLDDATLRAQLAQARARVANAAAQLASAEDTHRRMASLASEGGVSASELITRSTAVEIGRAAVAEGQAAVANIEAMLAQTRVTAPDDGLVLKRDAHLGDVSSVGRALFTLVRHNRLQVDAQVPETDMRHVRPGQAATITSDAVPGLAATGRVRELSPGLDAGSRQATVEIDLPAGSGFKVGMFVRAKLALGRVDAVAVPATAVVTRDFGAEVFVLEGGRAKTRTIKAGIRQGDWVAVREGLKPGEPVIISGVGFLKDGDKVDVAPALGARDAAQGAQP